MPTINDSALILLAPCSLLLGAVLQILVARLCSARTKGILAFLFLSSGSSRRRWHRAPRSRRGRQSSSICSNGTDRLPLSSTWTRSASCLHSWEQRSARWCFSTPSATWRTTSSATRFYCTMLVFIGGFIGTRLQRQPVRSSTSAGNWSDSAPSAWSASGTPTARPSCGARKVLLMTHIAGYGLLAAILIIYHRTGSALWTDPAVAHSFTGGVFLLMLVALVAKSVQVPLHTWIPEAMAAPTPVSALLHAACYVTAGVYLAARMHSFGVWPAGLGRNPYMDRHRHHGRRRDVRHGADRSQAHAGLLHRQPDRLHDAGHRHRHAARHHRRPAPLPQSWILQGRPLPHRRLRAARRRHARHEQARRPGAEDAAAPPCPG